MRKSRELTDPQSCLNRAAPDELLFVLRGRDPAAPSAIRSWAIERLKLGMNHGNDLQICEALECAELMEKQSEHRRKI